MASQQVLIPRRREVTLGSLIRSRSPDPVDVVEFDGVIVRKVDPRILPDIARGDTCVFPGDPRLDAIASASGRDENLFIKLCQEFRIIPSWWYQHVNTVPRVMFCNKWYVNRYVLGEISRYERMLLRAPETDVRRKKPRGARGPKLIRDMLYFIAKTKHHGISTVQLAERLDRSYSHVARTLDVMLQDGVLARNNDPEHYFGYVWVLPSYKTKESSCSPLP